MRRTLRSAIRRERPLARPLFRDRVSEKRKRVPAITRVKLVVYRILQGIVVLLIVSALTFALLGAAGGDTLSVLRNDPVVSRETVENLEHVYGLDHPLAVRYGRWLLNVVGGELGRSFYYQAPVGTVLWPRLANTLALSVFALLIACALTFALAPIAAKRPRSWLDRACSVFILLGASVPRIVIALLVLSVLARSAWYRAGAPAANLWPWLFHLVPPALVLSVPLSALLLAQARDGIREALSQPFIQTAVAKGLPGRVVMYRHALCAALNPLISVFGSSIGALVSGSVIVESVLGWPGLGQLSVIAVRSRDVPLLMGVVLVSAAAVLAGNLLADILLRLHDPRLRAEVL